MCSERSVLDLIGHIYEAAGDPRLWPPCLEKFADAVHGLSANLLSIDVQGLHSGLQASARVDPDQQRKYNEYYGGLDHWVVRAQPFVKTGAVLTSEFYCPREELVRTEFYNDFLRGLDILHNLVGIVFRDKSLVCAITAYRSESAGAFDSEETSLLKLLMPHLQRSIQLHRRIVGLETRSQAAADALDRLPMGLLLVDERGRILVLNRAARTIVDQKDGLKLTCDGLSAARSDETANLRKMISGASITSSGKGFDSGGAIAISRPSLKRPLQVLVTPLASNGFELGQERPAAAIFVTDPEAEVEPNEQVLRRLFGLTHAESKLTVMLIQGKTIEDVTGELNVTRNTVRTLLRRVFDKTDARRQSELVRLVLSGPAQIRSR